MEAMKKYRVIWTSTEYYTFEVEARTQLEASRIACEELDSTVADEKYRIDCIREIISPEAIGTDISSTEDCGITGIDSIEF